jgi:membrane protein
VHPFDTIRRNPVPEPTTTTVPRPAEGLRTRAQTAPQTYRGLVMSTTRYLMRTEVHTFAFSVAANAILSFFPFVMLLMVLIRRVFRSPAMYDVVVQLLRDYLPAGQEFVIRNLNAMVGAPIRHRLCPW